MIANIKPNPSIFWLNFGVLTPQEIDGLRQSNYNVTEFVHPINTNNKAAMEAAIETVQEHQFGQKIWVENVSNL